MRDERLLQQIGGSVVFVLQGIRQGKTFDSMYFVGLTMAFEKLLAGEDNLAEALFETAKTFANRS